jgi:AraC-like DNA-binding protein
MSRNSKLKTAFSRERLERIAIEADYDATKVAAWYQISTRQMERMFQSSLGCSPQRWLNELKVLKAQELLLAGRSVKETSEDLGYRHPSYFCYQFKFISGATPKSFLLRARK